MLFSSRLHKELPPKPKQNSASLGSALAGLSGGAFHTAPAPKNLAARGAAGAVSAAALCFVL